MNEIAAQQAALIAQLMGIANQLNSLSHKERSVFIRRQSSELNISNQTLYRWLKQKVGWSSGRKKRTDSGSSSMQDVDIFKVAAMQKSVIRKNGKLLMPTTVATSVAKQNGIKVPVGNSQVNRLMRQREISARQQEMQTPHVRMRSLYPNHVHQVDPSLCVLYYMGGKQHIMEADKFYKNKVDNYAKVKLKIWRYVLVDHASSYIVPWYVEAAGESPENLFEFLMYAWSKIGERDFHGVPTILIWDKGSANTASSIKCLADSLEVEHIAHTKGNARAKGAVEGGNNIVETQFESRLKFSPVESVEELNAGALAWACAYNANCIPGQDTRLRRQGLSTPIARSDLWHRITAAQLRLLPDVAVCRDFMVGKAATRVVQGDMTINFKHPKQPVTRQYDLTGCDGVNVKQTVEVSPLIYGDGLIKVSVTRYDDETLSYKLEPLLAHDDFGFRQEAPIVGEEYKRKPKTDREWAGDVLDAVAYGDLDEKQMDKAKDKAVPFGGELDTFEHLKKVALPTFLPRQGSEITTGQRFDEKPMSAIAAAKLLKSALGHQYSAVHLNYVKTNYPEGFISSDLDALIVQFKQSGVVSIVKEA